MKITTAQLKETIDTRNGTLVVDVLPDDAFASRHIPSAINACVYEIAFLEEIDKAAGAKKSTPLVVYDETGERDTARIAAERLLAAGYENVRILDGGLRAWRNAGLPLDGDGSTSRQIADGTYPLDLDQSVIDWTGRNIANKHWGSILLSAGEVVVKENTLAGGRIVIDMNSMTCADIADPKINAILIDHLKSADFFETDTWPEASLEITDVVPIENSSDGLPNTTLTADLTLHGVTHPVEFPCLIGRGGDGEIVAQGNFDLDRTHWNIRYGSGRFFEWLGKHLVNDLISLQVKMVVNAQNI